MTKKNKDWGEIIGLTFFFQCIIAFFLNLILRFFNVSFTGFWSEENIKLLVISLIVGFIIAIIIKQKN